MEASIFEYFGFMYLKILFPALCFIIHMESFTHSSLSSFSDSAPTVFCLTGDDPNAPHSVFFQHTPFSTFAGEQR